MARMGRATVCIVLAMLLLLAAFVSSEAAAKVGRRGRSKVSSAAAAAAGAGHRRKFVSDAHAGGGGDGEAAPGAPSLVAGSGPPAPGTPDDAGEETLDSLHEGEEPDMMENCAPEAKADGLSVGFCMSANRCAKLAESETVDSAKCTGEEKCCLLWSPKKTYNCGVGFETVGRCMPQADCVSTAVTAQAGKSDVELLLEADAATFGPLLDEPGGVPRGGCPPDSVCCIWNADPMGDLSPVGRVLGNEDLIGGPLVAAGPDLLSAGHGGGGSFRERMRVRRSQRHRTNRKKCEASCKDGSTPTAQNWCSPYNGCGPEAFPKALMDIMNAAFHIFVPCCNNHDDCYATVGISKEECDAKFYKCMESKCPALPWGTRWSCYRVAARLFFYVDRLGCFAWKSSQREHGCSGELISSKNGGRKCK